ncbi:L-histidine N(alpha)-methyltransferase [Marine Group I thaumarchaeote]|uniref:L-histidine N(Alpha)-methyltransferase n=1 Tax=Marine Group I thaumarchaeote TaxID=2511932 RepID=A0A7K4P9N3_9ARCH|nr:MAG: L-histidine N(alpha)-methyltransferase [Nitrosopumilus sp. YT1]NMI82513.1 L-histidine N(alpha)-methyltransferase [Candidatus Nitrosopumilus sp. MTA1]NWJ20737.1 L-histidine N(alpha)-methyltransferase [Marine Group I thaumarchaeote]NWJ29078.1 L-histidine N(alpha)-methyltransferase [Marine Group I thaumarchaeote]NWJ57309.1 L-histidine N(alpha)-methyltransferase [Marine Group I thaumarchaeote]
MSNTIQKNLDYKKYVVSSKLQYFKPHATKIQKTFAEEISYSLNRDSKFIDPKYFYDNKGSDLFKKICSLPEYYPTRTEISILKQLRDELPSYLDEHFRLVELGSGTSVKTRLILDILVKLQDTIEYFPIDISEILTESSEQLLKDYDRLHITGLIDTYEDGLKFLKTFDDKKNLIIFLGSSFGNFSPNDGYKFLQKINSTMKHGDLFLIGLDLVKDKQILESAYDDSQGVTAKFNLNILSRINDELDADFYLKNFSHYVIYNEEEQRIEMYLKSLVNQSVMVSKSNLLFNLEKDELILTEHSHKYKLSQISKLLHSTGFKIKHTWLDNNNHFSLTLASKN